MQSDKRVIQSQQRVTAQPQAQPQQKVTAQPQQKVTAQPPTQTQQRQIAAAGIACNYLNLPNTSVKFPDQFDKSSSEISFLRLVP